MLLRGEQAGGADQAGHMQVVPAGVHGAGGGGERLPGLLMDGEPVHVAAQEDGRAGRRLVVSAQDGDHGAEPDAGGDLQRQAV